MARDPIVEEIRVIREGLAKAHGYDVKKIVQTLQDQAQRGRRPVTLPAKRLPKKHVKTKVG